MLCVAAERLVLHEAISVAGFKAAVLMNLVGTMSMGESDDCLPFASVIGSMLLGELRIVTSSSKYSQYFWMLLRFLDIGGSRRVLPSNRFN
jgi:hypothetical protein